MAGALRLRQDLSLHPAQPDEHGAPGWVLHDPAANRYVRLPPVALEMLSVLGAGSPRAIAAATARRLGRPVSTGDAEALLTFLDRHDLLAPVGDLARGRLLDKRALGRRVGLPKLLGSLLMVRRPLVNPDRFLDRTLPWVRWWFSPWANRLVIGLAVVGLMLVLRQWDLFIAGIAQAFQGLGQGFGLLWYALGLTAVKALHELGHAYTAKRYGCRVPAIGVAVLVFWPVMYTDCSDAWKLRSRRARMAIDVAGVRVEMAVAALCLLAWTFLPDGPLRSLALLLATTSWLLTLLVNMNPLMRFDGYYLMADTLSVPNLQPRSIALAAWWLRRLLTGPGEAAPEPPRRWMIVYGWAVMLYRAMLTLVIALMVYAFVFKLLGVMMLVAQVGVFIVRPVFRELRRIGARWNSLPWARRGRLLVVLAVPVAVLLVPWRATIVAPAYVQAERMTHVYAAVDGRVVETPVAAGAQVVAATPLVVLDSPSLHHEAERLGLRADGLRRQVGISNLGGNRLLDRQAVLIADLHSTASRLATLDSRLRGLVLTAEGAGVVVDVLPDLRPGLWVGEGQRLMTVIDPAARLVVAFVREADLGRLDVGATGRFVPLRGGGATLEVQVAEIGVASVRELENGYPVAAGDIAVREGPDGAVMPVEPLYKVILSLADDAGEGEGPILAGMRAGSVLLDAPAQSIAAHAWRNILGVVRREAGG